MKIRNKKYNNQNIKFKSVKIEGGRKSLINNLHSLSFKNILIIILSLFFKIGSNSSTKKYEIKIIFY